MSKDISDAEWSEMWKDYYEDDVIIAPVIVDEYPGVDIPL